MIDVRIVRDRSQRVMEFSIRGHAFHADSGQDIVCAAVSILSQNTVNSIEALLDVVLPTIVTDGMLACRVNPIADTDLDDRLQLLLESMMIGLSAIARMYPDSVQIVSQESV